MTAVTEGPAGSHSAYGATLWGLWLPGEDPAKVSPALLVETAELAAHLRETLPGLKGGLALPVRCARLAWVVEAPKEKPPDSGTLAGAAAGGSQGTVGAPATGGTTGEGGVPWMGLK